MGEEGGRIVGNFIPLSKWEQKQKSSHQLRLMGADERGG